MTVPKEVQLRVADAKQRDVGHGKVRIDNETMQKLAITAGDFIDVHGKRTTVAIDCRSGDERAYAREEGHTHRHLRGYRGSAQRDPEDSGDGRTSTTPSRTLPAVRH